MLQVASFTFNDFAENTYVLYDDSQECIIFDPGCYTATEQQTLRRFIAEKNLKPVHLINTHCHIDHVLGNDFISQTYGLPVELHQLEVQLLENLPRQALMFGLERVQPCLAPRVYLSEGDTVSFGNTNLRILLTPGHSPGSLSFYNEAAQIVIAGDVLFRESIGRTDLPGGSFPVLLSSIRTKLFSLPDEVRVFCGHGEPTTIGHEKRYNPFMQD